MHFALVSVAFFAASASASNLFARQDNDPSPCVTKCLSASDPGSCSLDNPGCLCHNTAYVNSVIECIKNTCTSADLAAARELCLPFGVTFPAIFIEPATTSAAAAVSSTSGAPAATFSKSAGSSVDFAGMAAFAGLA